MRPDADDLPEAYKKARAADEPFWIEQERVIQGALGQPCCTLSGIGSGLIALPGEFAVVVHGEDECAACFRHLGPSSQNFYCTGLTENELITGETGPALDRCLRLVAAEVNPNAIFVLGACPVEVIGDRFEKVVEKVQRDFPQIPMVPMHTSGLKVGSQSAMLDWMFSALASLPVAEPVDVAWKRRLARVGMDMVSSFLSSDFHAMDWSRDRALELPERPKLDPARSLNLVGLPDHGHRGGQEAEVVEVLRRCGLHVVANFPKDASFDDWRAIKYAKATFVADRSLYPKLVNVLEASGQQVVDVPLPTGVEATRELYERIADVFGVRAELEAAIAPLEAKAKASLDAFRARFGRLRVAIGMRMLNNYEADQLAYQGLGDWRAFAELGFDSTLLVQGPPDKRERFEKMFERRGITHPFDLFTEPWTLSEHLGGGRFDVAYLADHCRTEARKAGVPMVVSRALEPWFEGVDHNLRHLEQMLSSFRPGDAA